MGQALSFCPGIHRTLDTFPTAPEFAHYGKKIAKLGKLWAESPDRPQPKPKALKHWQKLVHDWANDESLPIYVRKKVKGHARGSVLQRSGRRLVLTDNSPAQWAFARSYLDERQLSPNEIATKVRRHQVPIAVFQLNKFSKENINSAGWYLAHIKPVRLYGKLENLDISAIKDHFVRLMSPSNMFVIPTEYRGLAELEEFKKEIAVKIGQDFS